MPIIVKGKITNLSERPVVVKKTAITPTVTNFKRENQYLNKIESAKSSMFKKTIEGEKTGWTKSDYLVDMLSE
jgi:hypothetical protein